MESIATARGLITVIVDVNFLRIKGLGQRFVQITVRCVKALARDFVASGLHHPYRISVGNPVAISRRGVPR